MLFEQTINKIYNEVGKNAGLRYKVELKPYAKFKMGYEAKRDGSVSVYSSDYIKFAKADTIIRLAEQTTRAIKANDGTRVYNDNILNEFYKPNIYINARPFWASRCHGIIMNPKGDYHNLNDLYKEILQDDNIMKSGGFKNIDDVMFVWKNYKTSRKKPKYAEAHQTPKAITINKVLDSPIFPKEVMLYIIYHELLHIDQPFMKANHDAEFCRKENNYPNAEYIENKYFKVRGD
jgi:hypothetical protein